MGKKRELRLKSSKSHLHQIEKFVEEISEEYHLNDSYFGNILIALTEAFLNAVKHGNKEDDSKNVHILLQPKPAGLYFSVIDQGAGFNYKEYEDMDSLVKKGEETGRGILLIHSLCDEVTFSNKGRMITMLFKVTGIDTDIYEKRYSQMKSYFKSHEKVGSRQ